MLDAHRLDLLLVIGGYNSSNTTHLLEIGLEFGIPTFHIQDASCIADAASLRHQALHATFETTTPGWLEPGPRAIGVTAGASTPNVEIERVIRRVADIRGIEPE
jgi:4-hydroxy-3-methylbut-2-enyl diphosphate reductase